MEPQSHVEGQSPERLCQQLIVAVRVKLTCWCFCLTLVEPAELMQPEVNISEDAELHLKVTLTVLMLKRVAA